MRHPVCSLRIQVYSTTKLTQRHKCLLLPWWSNLLALVNSNSGGPMWFPTNTFSDTENSTRNDKSCWNVQTWQCTAELDLNFDNIKGIWTQKVCVRCNVICFLQFRVRRDEKEHPKHRWKYTRNTDESVLWRVKSVHLGDTDCKMKSFVRGWGGGHLLSQVFAASIVERFRVPEVLFSWKTEQPDTEQHSYYECCGGVWSPRQRSWPPTKNV